MATPGIARQVIGEASKNQLHKLAQAGFVKPQYLDSDAWEWLPDSFKAAVKNRKSARWNSSDGMDAEWRPFGDDDGWYKISYDHEYSTENGTVWHDVMHRDTDGDSDHEESAELGSPEEKELWDRYSGASPEHERAWKSYYEWVIANDGDDPLGEFWVESRRKRHYQWLIAFVKRGDKAVFQAARDRNKQEDNIVRDLDLLPEAVKDYCQLGPDGSWGDGTWEELKEFGRVSSDLEKREEAILVQMDLEAMETNDEVAAKARQEKVKRAKKALADVSRRLDRNNADA